MTYHNCSIATVGIKLLSYFVQDDLVGRSILIAFLLTSAEESTCDGMLHNMKSDGQLCLTASNSHFLIIIQNLCLLDVFSRLLRLLVLLLCKLPGAWVMHGSIYAGSESFLSSMSLAYLGCSSQTLAFAAATACRRTRMSGLGQAGQTSLLVLAKGSQATCLQPCRKCM